MLSLITVLSLLIPSFAIAAEETDTVDRSVAEVGAMRKGIRTITRQSSRTLKNTPKRQMTRETKRFSKVAVNLAGFMKTYTSEIHGLSIGYPKNWNVHDGYMGSVVSFISPLANRKDKLTENVNILVEESEKGYDLIESTSNAMEELKSLPDFKLLESRSWHIGYRPARSIIYSAVTNDGQHLKFKQVWTISGKKMYIFTFAAGETAFRDYVKIFDRMLQTVVVK